MKRITNKQELQVGQEVYVWGRLRKRHHIGNNDIHRNFPGRKGKVAVISQLPRAFISFEGVEGEWVFDFNNPNSTMKVKEEPRVVEVEPDVVIPEKTGLEKLQDLFRIIRDHDERDVALPNDISRQKMVGYDRPAMGYISLPRFRAFIAFVFEENDEVVFSSLDACHAGLKYLHGNTPKYVVSYVITGGSKLEDYQAAYLRWLFNYSVWKDVFITKTPEEAYETGIVLNVNMPDNIFAGGTIATRWATEHKEGCKAWFEFIKQGIPPDMAFLLSGNFKLGERGLVQKVVDAHSPLDFNLINRGMIERFTKNEPAHLNEHYRNTMRYVNVNSTWNGNGQYLLHKFIEVFDSIVAQQRQEAAANNPFGAVVQAVKAENTSKFVAKLMEIIRNA